MSPISGTNWGTDSVVVCFKVKLKPRTLMSIRLKYWADSVKKFLRSSFCTSVTVNLRFSVPNVVISTLSLSLILYSILNGWSSDVVAVTLTSFTPILWLMIVAESGFSLIVRLNLLGFGFLGCLALRLVFLLEKRSSTFLR